MFSNVCPSSPLALLVLNVCLGRFLCCVLGVLIIVVVVFFDASIHWSAKEFYADGVAMVSSRRLTAGQENGSMIGAEVKKARAFVNEIDMGLVRLSLIWFL